MAIVINVARVCTEIFTTEKIILSLSLVSRSKMQTISSLLRGTVLRRDVRKSREIERAREIDKWIDG